METGKLNRRISILVESSQQDEYGEPSSTWSPAYQCWANIDVQRSQLLYETAEFISKVTHRITVRWTRSFVITPAMRISYTEPATGVTHTYEIEAVLNDNQSNVWITMLAYELGGSE